MGRGEEGCSQIKIVDGDESISSEREKRERALSDCIHACQWNENRKYFLRSSLLTVGLSSISSSHTYFNKIKNVLYLR